MLHGFVKPSVLKYSFLLTSTSERTLKQYCLKRKYNLHNNFVANPEMQIVDPSQFNIFHNFLRYKSKGRKNVYEEEEFSDDEEPTFKEGELDEDGSRIKKFKIKSLRADNILKNAFGITRRRMEEMTFGNKIRLNGKILSKKGVDINPEDVLELFSESTAGDVEVKSMGKVTIKHIKPSNDGLFFDVVVALQKSE